MDALDNLAGRIPSPHITARVHQLKKIDWQGGFASPVASLTTKTISNAAENFTLGSLDQNYKTSMFFAI